ncbi:MAG TPA: peptidyl-prolyl cis-trans isomerase [Chthonomonadaceae bacterium]|nr:peptidyl-prolyl cis-trans isomerase [Chthonomonadaceae bacterium]
MHYRTVIARRRTHCLLLWGAMCCVLGAATPVSAQDKPVATINGEAINSSEFYQRLEHMHGKDFLIQISPNSPPSVRGETAGFLAMNLLINQHVILQLAAKNSTLPTDEEINAELALMTKQDEIKNALKDHQITEEELKTDLRVTLGRFKLATKGVTVTDAEVEEWYMKHKANYTLPERWGLSAIMTTKMEDLPKIQGAIKELSFAIAAHNYSEDTRTKEQGGKLGTFYAANNGLPEAIQTMVRKLNVGDVTSPIEVEFEQGGKKIKVWWIVKLDQRDPEIVRPYTEVKQEARQLAMIEKAGGFKAADDKIAEFRKQADIKINLAGYDALLNPAPKPK